MTKINPTPAEIEAVLSKAKAAGVRFVRLEYPDLHGISRSKTVPVARLKTYLEQGLNSPLPPLALDVQCEAVEGTGYLEERGYPDARLIPDPATFAVLPYAPGTARIIADPYHVPGGAPALGGTRLVAASLIEKARQLGFEILSGFEYEFYLLSADTLQPASNAVRQFATLDADDQALLYDIADGVAALGIDVTTINLEYGPSQFELNFAPALGITAADQAYSYKNAVKEIAAKRGKIASFITKPAIERSANGLHFNQSLLRDGQNAFSDPSSPDGLSQIARHYIAGLIAHAPALTALFAPTVNCGKRYRPHSFAPFEADWAIDNRTVAIRVKGAGTANAHIENRLGAGAANPYLVQAASLAAGLDGIRQKLEPPAPRVAGDESVRYRQLPARLQDSLAALEEDSVITDALGAEFIQVFTAVKRHELAKARRAVAGFDEASFHDRIDPWERREYALVL